MRLQAAAVELKRPSLLEAVLDRPLDQFEERGRKSYNSSNKSWL